MTTTPEVCPKCRAAKVSENMLPSGRIVVTGYGCGTKLEPADVPNDVRQSPRCEITCLTRERDELSGKLENIRKYLNHCGDLWGIKPDILAIIHKEPVR